MGIGLTGLPVTQLGQLPAGVGHFGTYAPAGQYLGAQNPAFQQNPFGGGVGALQQTTLQQLIPQQLHQLQYLQQYAAQQLQQLSQVVPQQLQQIQQLLQVLPQQIQQLQQQLAQQGIGSQSTGFGIPQGTSPWAWSMMAPSLGAPQGGAGFPTGQVM